MSFLYGSVIDTVREILGGWSKGDVIAVIAFAVVALLVGFLIGALIFRSVGYNKGRVKGERDSAAFAKKQAKEEASGRIEQVLRVAREKQAALQAEQAANRAELLEAQEKLRQAERSREEAEKSREEAERSREEAESFRVEAAQAVLRAEREKEAAAQAILAAEESKKEAEKKMQEAATSMQESEKRLQESERKVQESERKIQESEEKAIESEKKAQESEKKAQAAEISKLEAEKKAQAAEDKILSLSESEAASAPIVKERKEKITLLTKEEILAFAAELDEYLPASVYTRGGEELPDSCRVGICTFLLVYQRKHMVKLVLRLPKGTAEALQKRYTLFTRAVYPKGADWYKWILSSEVADLDAVTAAVRAAYKYVFLSNYDERTGEINVAYANRDEIRINEDILKYKDLPDRDFIVASDAADGAEASYRLYGKKEMAAYCRSLGDTYPVSVTESDGDLSPSIFRVGNKTFLMAYEKDGVAKMIFRLSEEGFDALKSKHPTAEISPFPKAKGYHWYVAYIDATFTSDADIESIIRSACAYMHEKYGSA